MVGYIIQVLKINKPLTKENTLNIHIWEFFPRSPKKLGLRTQRLDLTHGRKSYESVLYHRVERNYLFDFAE